MRAFSSNGNISPILWVDINHSYLHFLWRGIQLFTVLSRLSRGLRLFNQVILFEDFYSSGTDQSIARVTRWLGVPTAPITQPLGYRAYNW